MEENNDRESLINRNNKLSRSQSHAYDELKSFRSYLRWMCVDQSSMATACLSWATFVLFGLVVPATSHFVLACSSCDSRHGRPYDSVVQLSLSSVATLSFVCLSRFVRKYGLRRFLFFDKLCDESETVRRGYTNQLNVCLSISIYLCAKFLRLFGEYFYCLGAT
jgi:hypothetical protein